MALSGLVLFLGLLASSPALAQNCGITKNVKQSGGADAASISGALGLISSPLSTDACVVIRDTATYSEQVTVGNFTFAYSTNTLRIMADPTFVSSAPVVNPPASSLAAFRIQNTSVAVQNINIIATNTVQYGILASSYNITIASVNVDSNNRITAAGIALAGFSNVFYSSITVQAADGLYTNGAKNAVAFSSAQAASSSFAAFNLSGSAAAYNTLTSVFARNSNGHGIWLDNGANHNTIRQSVMVSGAGSYAGLSVTSSPDNTITQSDMSGAYGAYVNFSNNTSISFSTMSSGDGSNGPMALSVYQSNGSSILRSFISNPNGIAATFSNDCCHDISWSTFTSAATPQYNNNYHALKLLNESNVTISNCYIQSSTPVYITGSANTVINASLIVATAAFPSAVTMDNNAGLSLSFNTIKAGPLGAGIYLDANNAGSIMLSTNTILPGSRYGIYITTQAAAARVWISSNTILPALSDSIDTYGIYLNGLVSGATIQNNAIVYRDSGGTPGRTYYGLYSQSSRGLSFDHNRINQPGMVSGGSAIGAYFSGAQAAQFKFNDVNSTAGAVLQNAYLLQLVNSTVTIRNNIFFSSVSVSVSSASLRADQASGFDSNYNDFFSPNAFNAASWGNQASQFSSGWFGKDADSIGTDPLWADPGAAAEDFHLRSRAGRFNPGAQSFVNDGQISPAIDAGDRAEAAALEPAPNGLRVNLGSYGNTPEASKSLAPPVKNAQIFRVAPSSITVNWSPLPVSPPASSSETASGYILDASIVSDFSSLWGSTGTANVSLSTLVIANISADGIFYFRVGSLNSDGVPNYTFAGSAPVNAPPGAIADLSTGPVVAEDQVLLTWTAPGNNGLSGTAAGYDIRYSTGPITPANFSQAVVWSAARPVGGAAGTQETETVTGLTPGILYYFAVETRDPGGNISGLSNTISYLAGSQVTPSIQAFTPPEGASVVDVSTAVTVRFSKNSMSTSSFNAGFTLTAVLDKDGGIINQPAAGNISFSTAGRTMVFAPSAPLSKNYTYEVRVTTDIKDAGGAPVIAGAAWRFTTLFDHLSANTILGQAVRLQFSADTFSEDGYVLISTTVQNTLVRTATQKLKALDGFKNPVQTWDIRVLSAANASLQPSGNLDISLDYGDSNGDGLVDGSNPPVRPSTLALWFLDEANALWVKLPISNVNTSVQRVSSQIPHFSIFALIGAADADLSAAYAFPVPFKPGLGHQKISFVNAGQQSVVKVYTLRGELVCELVTGSDGRAEWDTANRGGQSTASGAYLYLITNGQSKKAGKLVIIR